MKNFPIVCVGGSAGGLDAYIRLLENLLSDMGVAIVIVNYVRTMPTLLHEILPNHTTMQVNLITENLYIEPNQVYIIPPQSRFTCSGRKVSAKTDIKAQGLARCDHSFFTLAN